MAKKKPAAKYLRFSEKANAVDYLRRAYESICRLRADPLQWKWMVIGLHGALYGFAICVLQRGNWETVTVPRKAGKHKLIDFTEAIRRCQEEDHVVQYVYSKPLGLSKEQKDSIAFLKKIRNQIEHYVPRLWSIEQHDLTVTAIDALDVVRSLAIECGNVHLQQGETENVEAWTSKGKRLLQNSQLYKDYLAAKNRLSRVGKPDQASNSSHRPRRALPWTAANR